MTTTDFTEDQEENPSIMWPGELDWSKRLHHKPENISLAGEAGIADANYLSSLVHSTGVGMGQLSGLAMQWESSHNAAVRLLKEELDLLSSQREEAEKKRRKILSDGGFYTDSKRSVMTDLQLQADQPTISSPVLQSQHQSPALNQNQRSAVPVTAVELDPDQVSVQYWRRKAETLNQLLTESLQREELLLRRLQREEIGLESIKPPVSELQSQLARVDNFLHFVLRNAPIVLCHQDKDLKYRFVYNQYPGYQSEIIGKTDLDLIQGPAAKETYEFKKEVIRRGCPAKREFVYQNSLYGVKAFLICGEPVFNKAGETIGINVVCMDVSEEVASREKLIHLREEAAVQRAMETQLHKTMRITEETMKAKQLLATMSHEIRSPLTGVVSMAEILAATTLDSEQQRLVDIMISSGDLVLQLINDILDLSKVESGAMKLEAVKFRPREVVRNVLEIAAASLQKRNLLLEGSVSADVPFEVVGDVLRIRQIFTNLVSNAIKFTREGSVRIIMEVIPHKKVSCSDNGSSLSESSSASVPQWINNNDTIWLECQVTDTGIGIPDSALPFLFTKYMQVSETHARKYGGTGLGLAICKQLVELMGGKLKVTSEVNKGSTFSFTLPCKVNKTTADNNGGLSSNGANSHFSFTSNRPARKATSRHLAAQQHQQESECPVSEVTTPSCSSPTQSSGSTTNRSSQQVRSTANSGSSNSKVEAVKADSNAKQSVKLLLAEDNKVNVMVAQRMLRSLDLQAVVVNNGAEAVEAVKKGEHYDLILMDVCMPVMDGLEATRLIREYQAQQMREGGSTESRRSTIVALTANALPENVAECYTHGMDSFIAKPITFIKLQQAIQQFLPTPPQQQQQQQQASCQNTC